MYVVKWPHFFGFLMRAVMNVWDLFPTAILPPGTMKANVKSFESNSVKLTQVREIDKVEATL